MSLDVKRWVVTYSRILLCSILLLIGSLVKGQGQGKVDSISILCQKWKIQELYRHSFKPSEQAELEEFVKTTVMEFNNDGSFVTKMDTLAITGKWQLTGNVIHIKMDEGDSFRMKIIFLTPATINFESRPDASENIQSAGVLVAIRNKYPNL